MTERELTVVSPTVPGMADLTGDDRALLTLERLWFRRPGAKDQAVRDQLGLTSTEYYRRLDVLLDRPEALAAEPVVVGRLRRVRDTRARARSVLRRAG